MHQKGDRLCPTAPSEKDDLEQRLDKKLNDVNSFNNHISNIKDMITYFKDKNHKSKKKYKKFKTLNTTPESVDTVVFNGATSTSITLSIVGIGLIVLQISAGTACTLALGNKVLLKTFINKHNKYKKQLEKDQQTVKLFDKPYRKSLQDNIHEKNESKSLRDFSTKIWEETQINLFYKHEHEKIKFNLFCNNKIKFNLEHKI